MHIPHPDVQAAPSAGLGRIQARVAEAMAAPRPPPPPESPTATPAQRAMYTPAWFRALPRPEYQAAPPPGLPGTLACPLLLFIFRAVWWFVFTSSILHSAATLYGKGTQNAFIFFQLLFFG